MNEFSRISKQHWQRNRWESHSTINIDKLRQKIDESRIMRKTGRQFRRAFKQNSNQSGESPNHQLSSSWPLSQANKERTRLDNRNVFFCFNFLRNGTTIWINTVLFYIVCVMDLPFFKQRKKKKQNYGLAIIIMINDEECFVLWDVPSP